MRLAVDPIIWMQTLDLTVRQFSIVTPFLPLRVMPLLEGEDDEAVTPRIVCPLQLSVTSSAPITMRAETSLVRLVLVAIVITVGSARVSINEDASPSTLNEPHHGVQVKV